VHSELDFFITAQKLLLSQLEIQKTFSKKKGRKNSQFFFMFYHVL